MQASSTQNKLEYQLVEERTASSLNPRNRHAGVNLIIPRFQEKLFFVEARLLALYPHLRLTEGT